jgi:hypothetical protein
MLTWHMLAAAMLAGPAQPSPYRPPANPPDPAAQRDEMIALYDEICLRAFPDDRAAGDAVARHNATPLTPAQMRILLHEDPGVGWAVDGRTGRFNVTIEAPPFHACAVRTMTAGGFADFGPYRALADRYEAGAGYRAMNPMQFTRDNLEVGGGGEQRATSDGGTESLLVILTTPTRPYRDRGDTAVEVRFTHQFAPPGMQ